MKKEPVYAIVAVIFLALTSCNNNPGGLSDKNIKEGYDLSRKYCASCHQFPDPSLLNKKTWEKYVLPKMAPYVGFEMFGDQYVASDSGIGLSFQQWNNIYKYYISQSPAKPLERDKDIGPIAKESPLFEEIPVKENIQMPSTTLVEVDALNKRILFSDGMLGIFFILSGVLFIIYSFNVCIGFVF